MTAPGAAAPLGPGPLVTPNGGPVELGPAAREVRATLTQLIQRGQLRPGAKLDPERELAATLGVSRATLRQALISMEHAGVVRREPGRGGGTYVASSKVDRSLTEIAGVPALLRDQGFTAGTRVLSIVVRAAGPDAASSLGLDPDDFVVDLVRIRLADAIPFSLERAILPADLVPGLPEKQLGGSLYELLDREYGLRPTEAIEHLEVVAATDDEASVLDVAPGDPLILVNRTTVNAEGRTFELSHDLFRADRTRISVRIQGGPADEAARLSGRIVQPLPPA